MYYYSDAMSFDKNARKFYWGHKWFDSCEKVCDRCEQMSFDPVCTSYPLAHFEPMIRKVFSRPPFDSGINLDEAKNYAKNIFDHWSQSWHRS